MIGFYTYLHCKPNGDPFYVGKGHGYRSHKFAIRNTHHKNIVAKYGRENIEILVFPADSEEKAFECEKKWIAALRQEGYVLANRTEGGDGIYGFHHSEETRRKIGLAHKGRKPTPEALAKMIANNKVGTPEVREKISKAHAGKTLSAEHKANISAAQKGRVGKKHSEETKQKLREARKHQIVTDETRAKLSAAAKADWAKRKREKESNIMQCTVPNHR